MAPPHRGGPPRAPCGEQGEDRPADPTARGPGPQVPVRGSRPGPYRGRAGSPGLPGAPHSPEGETGASGSGGETEAQRGPFTLWLPDPGGPTRRRLLSSGRLCLGGPALGELETPRFVGRAQPPGPATGAPTSPEPNPKDGGSGPGAGGPGARTMPAGAPRGRGPGDSRDAVWGLWGPGAERVPWGQPSTRAWGLQAGCGRQRAPTPLPGWRATQSAGQGLGAQQVAKAPGRPSLPFPPGPPASRSRSLRGRAPAGAAPEGWELAGPRPDAGALSSQSSASGCGARAPAGLAGPHCGPRSPASASSRALGPSAADPPGVGPRDTPHLPGAGRPALCGSTAPRPPSALSPSSAASTRPTGTAFAFSHSEQLRHFVS